ncbi:MAG: hypothetical protein M1817_004367 [Caeruleum heppii]|nr:MAG: hypothetical protein M1817_004367 [Caeruleum heppii]
MEDPNLIATLMPISSGQDTETAFRLPHNRARRLPRIETLAESSDIPYREGTPGPLQKDLNHAELVHRIQLTFSKKPKDPTKGYTLGTNPQACDVLLGPRSTRGISELHLRFTFDQQRRLVLRDSSSHGTTVSYNGNGEDEVRRHFTWILDLTKEDGDWDIVVRVPNKHGLAFKGKPTSRPWIMRRPIPPQPPSQSLSPKARPVYVSMQKLGSGTFGVVEKVIDVATTGVYARKQFYEPSPWHRNEKKRERQHRVWIESIRREVRIMSSNPHAGIVQVVDFWETPTPCLLMPYYPLGSLEDVHGDTPITWGDTKEILFQALTALAYLHPRGVAHRDLKPENILVASRSPLVIALADFGLANDKSDLKTCCDTRLYAPPEIYLSNKYGPSVDLWSLGVIVLRYGYGLPGTISENPSRHQNELSRMKDLTQSWCHCVVDHTQNLAADSLLDLLTTSMLRMKHEERLQADECLIKGEELGLFDRYIDDTGNSYRTTSLAASQHHDGHSTSTARVLGPLWATGGTSGDEYIGSIYRIPGHPSEAGSSLREEGRPSEETSDFPSKRRQTRPTKRRRAPLEGSAKQSSNHDRIKRSQADRPCRGSLVSRIYGVSEICRTLRGSSVMCHTMFDAVLALLTDLRVEGEASEAMDSQGVATMDRLCEQLIQLEITGIGLSHNGPSDGATIKLFSTTNDIVLARLTASELMYSAADLAAHLLLLLQLHFQTSITPIKPVDDLHVTTRSTGPGDCPPGGMTDSTVSESTMADDGSHGVTYPSALLDDTNISGCTIPLSTFVS